MPEPPEERCQANTDRELWREKEGDYYAPSVFVTEGGGIGMQVGGNVVVKPIRDWHALVWHDAPPQPAPSDTRTHVHSRECRDFDSGRIDCDAVDSEPVQPAPAGFEEALADLVHRTDDGTRYHDTKVERVRAEHAKEVERARSRTCVRCDGPMNQHSWSPVDGVICPLPTKDMLAESRAAGVLEGHAKGWRACSSHYMEKHNVGCMCGTTESQPREEPTRG